MDESNGGKLDGWMRAKSLVSNPSKSGGLKKRVRLPPLVLPSLAAARLPLLPTFVLARSHRSVSPPSMPPLAADIDVAPAIARPPLPFLDAHPRSRSSSPPSTFAPTSVDARSHCSTSPLLTPPLAVDAIATPPFPRRSPSPPSMFVPASVDARSHSSASPPSTPALAVDDASRNNCRSTSPPLPRR